MKDLLDKISSYNIFNYLFPGILFVFFSKNFTDYDLTQENNLIGGFLYYFIGMIISRFGSLIIEPFLKWTSFVKFSDYKSFILAAKKDDKINLLSEVNNTYRTITAAFFLLLMLKVYNCIETHLDLSKTVSIFISIIVILTIFLFSYKKQTRYVKNSVEILNKE